MDELDKWIKKLESQLDATRMMLEELRKERLHKLKLQQIAELNQQSKQEFSGDYRYAMCANCKQPYVVDQDGSCCDHPNRIKT